VRDGTQSKKRKEVKQKEEDKGKEQNERRVKT
jgi:hypothetical protein